MYHLSAYRLSSLLLLLVSMVCFSQSDIAFHGVDVYIATNEKVGIYSDIYLESSSRIQIEGSLLLNSKNQSLTIVNNTVDQIISGNGEVLLQPENSISLSGSNWIVNNLVVNGPANVNLFTGLTINQNLSLLNGRIFGNDNTTTFMGGLSGLFVNNIEENISYIAGSFRSYCQPGDQILFPVGNTSEYHPIELSNYFNNINWIEISYATASVAPVDEDISYLGDDWWQFTTDNADAEGYVNAQAYTYNYDVDLLGPNAFLALIHVSETEEQNNVPYFFDQNLLGSNLNEDKIAANQLKVSGYLNLADISANRIVIPNYINLDNNTGNYFTIQQIDQLDDPSIVIYTQWGNIVHKSELYQNDFDFTGYPLGTYFYTLTYKISGIEKTYQSFIELL